jgi:dolichol-phosphate mannosyltransferase
MPAYNEQDCIEPVLRAWRQVLANTVGGSFKILVINDGSKDKTGAILDQLATEMTELMPLHQANGGHGKALSTGYQKAVTLGAEWIFQVDSDDQFEPQDFAKLWSVKEQGSNFIMGHRLVRYDSGHRLVITKILRLLIFFLYGAYLKDANIPFRLIRSNYLRALLKRIPAFAFAPNIFLAVLAARDGQNLGEIPISHRDRQTGQVSIVRWGLIKACFRSAKELFFFRLHLNANLRSLKQEA